jgi:uncharacterized protein
MKIDIYSHYMPPEFIEAFSRRVGPPSMLAAFPESHANQNRYDLDARLRILEKFDGLVQVLTPTGSTIEKWAKPGDDIYLAQVFNDGLANAAAKHPDRFVGAVAVLPLANIDASLKEIDRTIKDMGFRGITLHTPINGKPLDSPEFIPIYEAMVKYDLPIWIHPTRYISQPDYPGENQSEYGLFRAFGWPYETTLGMARLVCSGIMARYPGIKFITHHAGAMVPFFACRLPMLTSPYAAVESFKLFYNDTALYGNPSALMCAQAFFGTDRILFGTDLPYGPGNGEEWCRAAIQAVEEMDISASAKKKIFEDNARKVLKMS